MCVMVKDLSSSYELRRSQTVEIVYLVPISSTSSDVDELAMIFCAYLDNVAGGMSGVEEDLLKSGKCKIRALRIFSLDYFMLIRVDATHR